MVVLMIYLVLSSQEARTGESSKSEARLGYSFLKNNKQHVQFHTKTKTKKQKIKTNP